MAVNAVIHEVRRRAGGAIHDLSPAVDSLWRNRRADDATDQPPIANISILGSTEVAAERSSE
jgi:hypothetical protein